MTADAGTTCNMAVRNVGVLNMLILNMTGT